MTDWALNDAKRQFHVVVDAALAGTPQRVVGTKTRDVVVIAAAEYERLCQMESSKLPSLGKLLLEMPQDDGEFERLPISPRDVDF